MVEELKLLVDNVNGYEYWASCRGWLYAVRDDDMVRVLKGRFFGIARHGGRVYVAGTGATAGGHDATFMGFVLSFACGSYGTLGAYGANGSGARGKGRLSDLRIEVSGIDNGVHHLLVGTSTSTSTSTQGGVNGVKHHMYALETHAQRIVRFRMDPKTGALDPTPEYIHPFREAANAHWVRLPKYAHLRDALPEYLHANALTQHDGLFYVMCPRLRSALDASGNPTNDPTAMSSVRVYSEAWEQLREYELGRRFCHDAVIVGHELHFLDADNTLCKLNLVTGEVTLLYNVCGSEPGWRAVCRALSIAENGDVAFSTTRLEGDQEARTMGHGSGCYLVRVRAPRPGHEGNPRTEGTKGTEETEGTEENNAQITPLPVDGTDGWSLTHMTLIHGEDYNQATSVLRAPAGVHQVRLLTPHLSQLRYTFDVAYEVAMNVVGNHQRRGPCGPNGPNGPPNNEPNNGPNGQPPNGPPNHDPNTPPNGPNIQNGPPNGPPFGGRFGCTMEKYSVSPENAAHAHVPEDLAQLLNPPATAFEHGIGVRHFHTGKRGKARLGSPELEPNLPPPLVLAHDKLKAIAKDAGVEESGALFLYPEGHGMGFHTNLDNEQSGRTIRMYQVRNDQPFGSSYFLYRHPYSGKIHAVPDREGYANVFDLRDPVSPIWHGVTCLRGQRLSYGVRMTREDAQRLQIPLPPL